MNPLDTYLAKLEISNAAFAEKVALSEATISRLRRGKQGHSFDLLERIAAVTNGAATPNDFLDIAPSL